MKLTLTYVEAQFAIRKLYGLANDALVEIAQEGAFPVKPVLSINMTTAMAYIDNLIRGDNKIMAIKEYRNQARVGLYEAKSVVENWDSAVRLIRERGQWATWQNGQLVA